MVCPIGATSMVEARNRKAGWLPKPGTHPYNGLQQFGGEGWRGGRLRACLGGCHDQSAWLIDAPTKAAPRPATMLATTLAAAKNLAPSSVSRSVSYDSVE